MPLIYWAVATLVGGFVGFFSAYLNKKGENLAMHEDIRKLTAATKEIEAKISNEVWDRQKRWELRKDAAFEAVKELASVQRSLKMLLSAHTILGSDPQEESQIAAQRDVLEKHYETATTFLRVKMLATIACGKEVSDEFDRLENLATLIVNRATGGDITSAYDKFSEFVKGTYQLARMIRDDLYV